MEKKRAFMLICLLLPFFLLMFIEFNAEFGLIGRFITGEHNTELDRNVGDNKVPRFVRPKGKTQDLQGSSSSSSSSQRPFGRQSSNEPHKELNDKGYKMWLEEQQKMKKQIQKTCSRYGTAIRTSIRDTSRQYYDEKHKLFNCRNAKVGTRTLTELFLTLMNKDDSHKIRVSNTDSDLRTILSTSISFSFVRHPFERLLSAYRAKLEESKTSEMNGLRKQMLKEHSKITFPNFVASVLKGQENTHWLPFITQCGYCTVPYTVIGKMESMDEDLQYIGKMAGVKFEQLHNNERTKGGSTDDVLEDYYAQIDRKLVMQLYELYKVDFEMFGYSLDEYI